VAARGFQKRPLLASPFQFLCTDNTQAKYKNASGYLTLYKHNKRSLDPFFSYVNTTLTLDATSNSEKHLTNHHDIVGPCHHGMARPQVADRGTASDKEGSCEKIE